MADLSDVESALVDIAATSLGLGESYLDGALSITTFGAPCRVYRGWPTAGALNADLAQGIAHISVFPPPGATRNMTRHFYRWHTTADVVPTLTAAVAGNTVTFDGIGSAGQVAGVRFGPKNGGSNYAYRLAIWDTPFTVAAEFGTRIPGSSVAGNVLTVPTDYGLQARVVADQPAFLETRRQEQQIWVSGWCPNPRMRDQLMSTIDAGYANMMDQFGRPTIQFSLPDGSSAILRYQSSRTDDVPQSAALWRRDLRYRVEYATTLLQQQPEVLFIGERLYPNDADIVVFIGDLLSGDTQDSQTLRATANVGIAGILSNAQSDNALSNIATLTAQQDDNVIAVNFAIGTGRIGEDFIG